LLKTKKSYLEYFINFTKNPELLFYVWLLALTIACYGLLIPFLGFYWDDIPYLYLFHNFGPFGFPEFVSFDRPFSAWIFMLTTALFGYKPIFYHLFALVLRFASAVLFSKIIQNLWPKNIAFRQISASLFLVYPGFLQQPIAVIYNHHLSVLCLFLLSIELMLENLKKEKNKNLPFIISILASLHMFSIENFATLELIRPVLIYIVLNQQEKNEGLFKKILMHWLPYLSIFLVFLIWRTIIFSFPSYQPGFFDILKENPLSAWTSLFSRIPKDFQTATIGAWIERFNIPTVANFGKTATTIFWVLVLSSFLATFVYFGLMQKTNPTQLFPASQFLKVFLIGLLLFFLAGSIVWVLELPLEIEFAWDRMTLAFIPATAILLACLLASIQKFQPIRHIALGVLISMAIGSHFQNSMSYKRDWDIFKDFLWQLSWRMPNLKQNTTLLGSQIGLNYYSDNSLTPAINFIYQDGEPSQQYNTLFYFTEVRLGTRIPEMEKGIPIGQSQRSFYFEGNTSDVVALRFKPPGCVQVMDNIYSNSITNLNLSDLQVEEIKLSNLNRISEQPAHQPPLFLAGNEPDKTWCYFFQKADLARQFKKYDVVAFLGDEAVALGLSPRIASEWLPFLEGYLQIGNFDTAREIANHISGAEGNYRNGLCYTLNRLEQQPDFPYKNELIEFIKVYNCY